MKFSMRAPKLYIGLLIVALIVAVSVFTDFGPGYASPAEADGGSNTKQEAGFGDYGEGVGSGNFGGGTQSFGGTWTGWD